MTLPKSTADGGFVTLILPTGASRSARLVLPPDVARWLTQQLIEANGWPSQGTLPSRPAEPDPQPSPFSQGTQHPRRQVRLKRGRWIGSAS